ncbi:MAG: DNA helicase RecG, partial [Clostridia bacterium]|nr:DNA helicase RecG [Clostridia bacterium]
VGRGQWQSYCIMFCQGGEIAKQRMKVMCETDDGFKIAEKDLELRGPGEFLGTRQHGLPQMRVGDLMTDMQLLKEAQTAANIVLKWNDERRDEALISIRKQIDEKLEKEGGILN